MGRTKKIKTSILLSSLLLAGCLEAPDETKKEIEGLLVRADAYAQQNQYRAAVIESKNVLQKDADNIDAKLIMARINIELGGLSYASTMLEDIDSDRPDVQLLLAKSYIYQGKTKSARKIIDRLKDKTLTNEQKELIKYIKANIYVQSQRKDEAKALFTEVKDAPAASKLIKSDSHLALIKMLVIDKDMAKADQELELLLQNYPKHTDSLILKSKIAYKNNDLEQSEDLLSKALITLERSDVITDKRISVLRNLSHLLAKRGRPAEAMVYNRIIADARPDNSDTRNKIERAVEAYESGETDEAETMLNELYNEGKTDYVGMLLGAIKLERKEYNQAYALFAQHIDPETASPAALNMLTEAQLRQNKPEEVLASIELNVKKQPKDAQQQAILGLASLAVGKEEQGVAAINKALELDPSKARLRVALAKHYNQKQEPQKAIEQLKLAIKEAPGDNALKTMLIQQLIASNQTDKALANAKQYMDESKSITSQLLYAATLQQADKASEAIKIYKSILKTHPGEAEALRALAIHHAQSGQKEQAIELANRLIAVSPNDPYGYQILYATADSSEKLKELTNTYSQVMAQNKSIWAPAPFVIVNMIQNKALDQADDIAEQLTLSANKKLIPKQGAVGAWNILLKHYASTQDQKGIRNALMGKLALAPNNVDLNIELVEHEIKSKNFDEARKLIANMLKSNTVPKEITYIMDGDLKFAENDYDGAIKNYQRVWDKFKSNKLGARLHSALLKTPNGAEKAQKVLNEWLEHIPNSAQGLTLLGNQYMSQGNKKEAMASFKRALTTSPNNPIVLNNLAWLEYEAGILDKAQARAEKAFRIMPKNAAIADTYGWILLKAGDKTKAIKVLEHAAKLAPNNAEIANHLKKAKQG